MIQRGWSGVQLLAGVAGWAGCALLGGDQALEFVEPILDEDYLGWELRTQHQEPTVGSQSSCLFPAEQ